MRTKSFGYGKFSGHTYCKKVGNGWETGFIFNHKTVFVGNFIHRSEATGWFTAMNREITHFSKRYKVGTQFPVTWFSHFFSNHLYKKYYAHLDTVFARHNRNFAQAVVRDLRKYKAMKKNWSNKTRPVFSKVA